MTFQRNRLRAALTLAGAAAIVSLAACGEDDIDIVSPPALQDELFRTYVAMGNSITAGYQSSGILDSTQRESYALYLAGLMGTTYEYQSLNSPGCPAPVDTFGSPNRYGNVTSSTACAQLLPQRRPTVNNVAVPGATIADATSNNTGSTNGLTLLLSGGQSQVTRMLAADPTFVSVWLGNNDVLGAATLGLPTAQAAIPGIPGTASPGLTALNTFTTRYEVMVDSIKLAKRLKGGVLVGVVDVTNIPYFFTGAQLDNPVNRAMLNAAAGRVVTVLANCTGNTDALIGVQILSLLRANPAVPVSCGKIPNTSGGAGTDPVVGELFILDAEERAAVSARVAAYNAVIAAQAEELGFAYWDPNPTLAAQRTGATPAVPAFPNFASAVEPFGALFSLDAVHPRRLAHKVITNALAAVIDAKYGTSLGEVTVN